MVLSNSDAKKGKEIANTFPSLLSTKLPTFSYQKTKTIDDLQSFIMLKLDVCKFKSHFYSHVSV